MVEHPESAAKTITIRIKCFIIKLSLVTVGRWLRLPKQLLSSRTCVPNDTLILFNKARHTRGMNQLIPSLVIELSGKANERDYLAHEFGIAMLEHPEIEDVLADLFMVLTGELQ